MAESTEREQVFVFGPQPEIQDQLDFKKSEKLGK